MTIFVRQLGGKILEPAPDVIGTTVRIRFPWLATPPGGPARIAA